MSHHAGGHVPPFVTSITPNSCTAAGNTTFTFEGTRFSPSMKVEVPESFGTLVSKTITYPTSTTSRCVLVINVNEPSDTAVTHSIKFYNGGEFAANDSESNVVHTSWTPAALCTGSTDYWWNPDSLSGSRSDGDYAMPYSSSDGGDTLVLTDGTQSTVHYYVDNHLWSTVSGSEKRASGIGRPPGSLGSSTNYSADTVIPMQNGLQSGSSNLEHITVAFVAKNVGTSGSWGENSKRPINFYLGGTNNMVYFKSSDGWRAYGLPWLGRGNPSFNDAGTMVAVYATFSNGTVRLRIPSVGIDSTSTYTPFPAPTDESLIFYSYQRSPVLWGEFLLLNRTISESDLVELSSYWHQKYGV